MSALLSMLPFAPVDALLVIPATAAVLLLAANTAFNGFPLLGSVLARDGYAPKALNTRGDRLVYSNGMIILGLAAVLVLILFQAKLTTLIQLYIIGVFVSFSLGQIGMVRHWRRELRLLARGTSATAVDARREPTVGRRGGFKMAHKSRLTSSWTGRSTTSCISSAAS